MNITMIGPVYPYKTGLSYYVGLLYKKLKENNCVKLYSYSMQYPKILYKKPQKDYDDDVVKVEDAEFVLNSANPFSWIRLVRKINKSETELVILQWLHPYFAPCYWTISRFLKKAKILCICHNAIPHERFVFDRFLTRIALKQADYIVAHSKSDEAILKELLPNAQIKVNPHPAYNFFKIKNMSQNEAREILGVQKDTKMLLFFGLVREYKGLKHLIRAMPQIVEDIGKIQLFIAGDFGEDKQSYIEMIADLQIGDYIKIHDGHIPIPEVEKFFAACDMVVLPYESATQSGVIQVAYGFNKPVLATEVGGLPDAVDHMKTGYLVEAMNPSAIAMAVKDYFENSREEEFASHIQEMSYKFSWDRMEETIKEFL